MRFLVILSVLSLVTLKGSAQDSATTQFEKVSIPECGCAVYMPNGSPAFDTSFSEDSSWVFTSEYINPDGFGFVAIAVRFKIPLDQDKAANEEMLIQYLDYLKTQYKISEAAGYGKGHTLEGVPDASGILDYWQDEDGLKYSVKGWINKSNLAVLMVYGEDEYPDFNAEELFLNGFRLE